LLKTTVPLKLRCEVFKNILSGNGILLKSRTLTFGYVLSESNNLLASSGFSNLSKKELWYGEIRKRNFRPELVAISLNSFPDKTVSSA